MSRSTRTTGTPLLDWQPPELAPRFDEVCVRSVSWRGRMAKAVSTALKECGMDREEVAVKMSDFLGEEVSKPMLDAYASEAREEHTISAVRLFALANITDDPRLFQVMCEGSGYVVIPEKYQAAIEEAIWTDREEEAAQRKVLARRVWKGGR